MDQPSPFVARAHSFPGVPLPAETEPLPNRAQFAPLSARPEFGYSQRSILGVSVEEWRPGRRRGTRSRVAGDLLSPLPGATVLLSQEVAPRAFTFWATLFRSGKLAEKSFARASPRGRLVAHQLCEPSDLKGAPLPYDAAPAVRLRAPRLSNKDTTVVSNSRTIRKSD